MAANAVEGADARPAFRVAVFGLAQKFQRVLEIVLKHARHNQYRFVVAPTRGPGEYDIALVDMTAKGGFEVASTLKRLPNGRPIVTVGRRTDPIRGRDDLLQVTFTMDLLKTLNAVVEQQLVRAREAMRLYPAGAREARKTAAGQRVDAAAAGQAAPAGAATLEAGPAFAAMPPAGQMARGVMSIVPGAGASQAAGGPGAIGSGFPRALLIDDSPTVRRQLAVALSQIGVTSESVDCAAAALARLAQQRFDIVFVDVVMPDMDGLRLIREIKRDRAARDVPIVILTSRSSPFDLARGALAGCSSYLVKPVALKTLQATVARHLQRRGARQLFASPQTGTA